MVLVHGAWHGAWCWERVVAGLEDRGISAVAIDLPGHGASTAPLGDLRDDAAALRAVLDETGPAVVCGHSYGGAVISEGAAGHPATRHLVYLGAVMLAPGESCSVAVPAEDGDTPSLLPEYLRPGDDGILRIDAAGVGPALYADCTPDEVAWVASRLCGQTMASLSTPATAAAWQESPSTYVVCAEDRAIPVEVQRRLATRAGDIVEWPTSHSPFLSRPELVVGLLADRVAALDS